LKFNTPASFVQGIKDMFSVRRLDPEGWVATDFWWHAWNRHMFIFLFGAGKNTAGAVWHEIEAVLLQPKSWRMASHESRVQKFARQLCVTNVGNVTVMV